MNLSFLDEVKLTLKSALVSAPRTLNVLELQKDYKKLTGSDIPYKKLGFSDIFAFLDSCDDFLRIRGHEPYAPVTMVKTGKSSHIRDMIDEFAANRTKYTQKNKNNRTPLQFKANELNVPAPIQPTWVPSKPKAEQHPLPKAATTNESACKPNKKTIDDDMDDALPEILDIHPSIWNMSLPKDVLKLGQRIPKYSQEGETKIQLGQALEVVLVEVESPHSFYMQLIEDGYSMREMHRLMKVHYESKGDEMVFPAALLQSGQPCVVLYQSDYFRAEIIKSMHAGDTKERAFQVRLVDFGTKTVVQARNIKFLVKDFGRQPQQCIQGCLANISSFIYPWPRQYKEKFVELIYMKTLKAKVVGIDNEGKVHVTLKIEQEGNAVIDITQEMITLPGVLWEGVTNMEDYI